MPPDWPTHFFFIPLLFVSVHMCIIYILCLHLFTSFVFLFFFFSKSFTLLNLPCLWCRCLISIDSHLYFNYLLFHTIFRLLFVSLFLPILPCLISCFHSFSFTFITIIWCFHSFSFKRSSSRVLSSLLFSLFFFFFIKADCTSFYVILNILFVVFLSSSLSHIH